MSVGEGRAGPAAPELDHVVINALRRMDEAAALFTGLGFRLTPLGRHSLGSVNHLMMTPGPYLEIVGVPEGGPPRLDLLDSPPGLNGLVLKSHDADETHAALVGAGLPAGRPALLTRPVALGDRTEEARFRTVRLPPGFLPAGRVYHCEHLTPDLVWRAPWLTHPNGFRGIDGLAIESPDPEAEAARTAAACRTQAERAGDVWRVRLGAARVEIRPGPTARFADLALRFDGLAVLEAHARAVPGADFARRGADEARLDLSAFDLSLICRGA